MASASSSSVSTSERISALTSAMTGLGSREGETAMTTTTSSDTSSDSRTADSETGSSSALTTQDSDKPMPSTQLNLKVKSQDGNEVYFKVKLTTQFAKIMTAYCKKVGAEADSVRFLFDGTRIRPDQTPEELNMMDDDEIDAMVSQTGGYRRKRKNMND